MQGAYPLPPERDPLQGPLKTSGTATLALASGVLSFLCLWGVGGVGGARGGEVAAGIRVTPFRSIPMSVTAERRLADERVRQAAQLAGVSVAVMAALGKQSLSWIPWRSIAASAASLGAIAILVTVAGPGLPAAPWAGLLAAACAGLLVLGATWWGGSDLRVALAR